LNAHDSTFQGCTTGSVYKNGTAFDFSMDFHDTPNNNNLIQDVDCGLCTRVYLAGGKVPNSAFKAGKLIRSECFDIRLNYLAKSN